MFASEFEVTEADQRLQAFLLERSVHERQAVARQTFIKNDTADGRIYHAIDILADRRTQNVLRTVFERKVDQVAAPTQPDLGLRFDHACVQSKQHVIDRVEGLAFAPHFVAAERKVIAAEDDVLRRYRDRLARSRRKQVVRRKHQDARFDLSFGRERNVDGHLVAVKVGVERGTDERMDLDRLALDKDRFESLDTEAVKRRRTVEQDRMFADHLFEDVPDDRFLVFDHFPGLFDSSRMSILFKLVVNERLEKLERHLFRQAALMEFEFRPDDDHRTARIVDTLAEQILAEAALFAL